MNRQIILALIATAISGLSNIGTVHARYEMMDGKGWRFCEAIYAEIKRQEDKDEREWKPFQCMAQAVRSLPGVTEPEWKELDVRQHEGLLRNLALYQRINPTAYFDPEYRKREIERVSKFHPVENSLDHAVKSAREGKVGLLVARVNVMHKHPLTGEPDPQPETIVRIVSRAPISESHMRAEIEDCNRRYPGVSREGRDYLVKDDLSDLDPDRTPRWNASNSVAPGMVVYFEGKDYVAQGLDDMVVLRDAFNTGYVAPVCWIRYRLEPAINSSKGRRK